MDDRYQADPSEVVADMSEIGTSFFFLAAGAFTVFVAIFAAVYIAVQLWINLAPLVERALA